MGRREGEERGWDGRGGARACPLHIISGYATARSQGRGHIVAASRLQLVIITQPES